MPPNWLRLLVRLRMLGRAALHARQGLAVAFLGLVVSVIAYAVADHVDNSRVAADLKFRAEWRLQDIQNKVHVAELPVLATASFASSQDQVFRSEFLPFVRELRNATPSLQRMSWVPFVRHEQRAEFEIFGGISTELGYRISDRLEDGGFAAATTRPFYAPLLLTQVFDGAAPQPGYDLLQDAVRGPLLRRAADEGRLRAATAMLPTAHDQADGEAILYLAMPIYSGGASDTVGQRRESLRGFILGEYRVLRLLQLAVEGTPAMPEAIIVSVAASERGSGKRQVAIHDHRRLDFVAPNLLRYQPPPGERIALDFVTAGQFWELEFHFPAAMVKELNSAGPMAVLLCCLLLTMLTTAYVLRQQHQNSHVQNVVTERTRDLTQAIAALAGEVDERWRVEHMLREQAETLTAALSVMPIAMIYLDPRHRILFWSPASERIFGYSGEEMLRRRYNLSPPGEADAMAEALERVAAGEVLLNQPVRCKHKDGRVLEVDFSGAGLFNDGKLRGIVGMLEDVTARRATEAQLLQAQKMDALGQLTGGLAHDFNNLLLVIMGNLQLLQDRRADDDLVREFSSQAFDAATRGADLVRSLLAFARRQPLQPRPMNINVIVSTMTKMLARVLGEKVEVLLQLDDDLWDVMIDPVQLEAALANLATNARDAMPRGGRLTIATGNRQLDDSYVSLHPDVTPGDYTMLQVSDTGEGMPPEVMRRIFEPFFTTKEPGRGSGLGLSMVFGFMKQSGGHVNVYSEVGVGTTFRLYLPRHRGAVVAVPEVAAQPVVKGGSETILVVEDDPALRRLVVLQITNLGYQVLEAENATTAFSLLEGGAKVDLVFSDVVMAGKMDGLDLVRLVPRRWPHIRVLLTSGFPDTDMEHDPANPCAPRLLSKPYRRDELAKTLRDMLDCDPNLFV